MVFLYRWDLTIKTWEIISPGLLCSSHYDQLASRVYKNMGLICRNFGNTDSVNNKKVFLFIHCQSTACIILLPTIEDTHDVGCYHKQVHSECFFHGLVVKTGTLCLLFHICIYDINGI